MKIKQLETTREVVSEGELFQSIDNYIKKSRYPKALVLKKFELMTNNIVETISRFKKPLSEGYSTLVKLRKENRAIRMDCLGKIESLKEEFKK